MGCVINMLRTICENECRCIKLDFFKVLVNYIYLIVQKASQVFFYLQHFSELNQGNTVDIRTYTCEALFNLSL